MVKAKLSNAKFLIAERALFRDSINSHVNKAFLLAQFLGAVVGGIAANSDHLVEGAGFSSRRHVGTLAIYGACHHRLPILGLGRNGFFHP
jgi:hypothetical protein